MAKTVFGIVLALAGAAILAGKVMHVAVFATYSTGAGGVAQILAVMAASIIVVAGIYTARAGLRGRSAGIQPHQTITVPQPIGLSGGHGQSIPPPTRRS